MIQWMDDFQSYGENEALMGDGLYADYSMVLTDDPDPNEAGKCVRFDQLDVMRKVLSTARQTVGQAGRFWFNGFVNGLHEIFRFYGDTAQVHVAVECDVNGYIRVYRAGTTGTELGATSGPVLVPGAWQHVEVWTTIDDSAGTVEVRVEGVVVLSLDTQDTKNGGSDSLIYSVGAAYRSAGSTTSFYLKDWIALDATGSYNSDFIGSCAVIRLSTVSDVALNWLTSAGATGFDLIDDVPPNDDTDYIYADDSPPAASVFELSDLPEDVTTVRGLMILHRSRKTDGGDGNLQFSLRYNGSDADGADRPMTTAFTYWADVIEENPDTSMAFTPVEVDDVQLVANRTV